ncbi:MAG: hypothetical protein KDB48_03430, partial [Solirubrobacterales bacterium]|nr:hypothetical protein [Solirubrobacterales bacterium]
GFFAADLVAAFLTPGFLAFALEVGLAVDFEADLAVDFAVDLAFVLVAAVLVAAFFAGFFFAAGLDDRFTGLTSAKAFSILVIASLIDFSASFASFSRRFLVAA